MLKMMEEICVCANIILFRSSVPVTKQANKNLILKATAEAEKSVSSAMDAVLREEKLYSAKGKLFLPVLV